MLLLPSGRRAARRPTIYHFRQSAKTRLWPETKKARRISPRLSRHFDRFVPVPDLVAAHQPMRIAVKVLGGKFKQLGILYRFHLMNQSDRHVHAFARIQFELLDRGAFRRLLDSHDQFAAAQVERFGLELVVMQRALLALANFQNFPAVEIAVCDPYLAAPSLGHNQNRFSCSIHAIRSSSRARSGSSEIIAPRACNFSTTPPPGYRDQAAIRGDSGAGPNDRDRK